MENASSLLQVLGNKAAGMIWSSLFIWNYAQVLIALFSTGPDCPDINFPF